MFSGNFKYQGDSVIFTVSGLTIPSNANDLSLTFEILVKWSEIDATGVEVEYDIDEFTGFPLVLAGTE